MKARQGAKKGLQYPEGPAPILETSKGSASSESTDLSWLQLVDPCHSLSIHSHLNPSLPYEFYKVVTVDALRTLRVASFQGHQNHLKRWQIQKWKTKFNTLKRQNLWTINLSYLGLVNKTHLHILQDLSLKLLKLLRFLYKQKNFNHQTSASQPLLSINDGLLHFIPQIWRFWRLHHRRFQTDQNQLHRGPCHVL